MKREDMYAITALEPTPYIIERKYFIIAGPCLTGWKAWNEGIGAIEANTSTTPEQRKIQTEYLLCVSKTSLREYGVILEETATTMTETSKLTKMVYNITFKVLYEHKGFITFFEGDTVECRTSQVEVSSNDTDTFSTVRISAYSAIFYKLGVYIMKGYIQRFTVDGAEEKGIHA